MVIGYVVLVLGMGNDNDGACVYGGEYIRGNGCGCIILGVGVPGGGGVG